MDNTVGKMIGVLKDKSKTEQLRFNLVLLFVFMLPFDRFYTSVILMLLIATTLTDLSLTRIKMIPRQFWIFQMFFFLACLGYFYSYNKSEAGFLIERQLAILIFPLLLPVSINFSSQRVESVMRVLCLSCLVTTLWLFAKIILVVKSGSLPLNYIFSKEFFNHNFSAPINIHAGYLSLYLSFSTLYLIKLFLTSGTTVRKIVTGSLIAILLAGLFFLASRNTLISTALITFFVVPFFFVKRKVRFFTAAIITILICFFAFSKISYLNSRFSSGLINDINADSKSEYSFEGAEPRIKRWEGALELFRKSPIFGYGTGDEIPMLKTKYVEHELFVSYFESFNAHNQYLSYALKNGLFGLLIFLGVFVYYLRLAIRHKCYIYLCFLTLLLIGFFTENILDANKGIFFFAFFNTLLGYTLLRREKTGFAGPVG